MGQRCLHLQRVCRTVCAASPSACVQGLLQLLMHVVNYYMQAVLSRRCAGKNEACAAHVSEKACVTKTVGLYCN